MSVQNESVVDSRVVEMTLRNQSFEKNATESISTISKLKKALDFSDAGKGLEDISRASKNIKMDTLSNGLQAASQGFSALETVAFGALANIGAKISDTAVRIGKMFTIDPVTDGFKEYELKMGSVQTIMASTGESLDSVNGYLEELNHYADKTIYSFSDMTNSIGKFTNAGVSLEDAVAAIQGISNEAAVSGANAQQASHAMYNFAQALSSGYVKLIDWKSIENANMATVEFKNQLLETAAEMGTVAKQADGTYKVLTHGSGSKGMKETISATKNFNDSLQQQWMTTDVLTTTLAKYADETSDIGKKAFAAATEVKTFSQLVDTLKEAAGSGWAQTWEILVGDFNEAKELFTYLSNTFGGIIDGMSDFRNNFLREALGTPVKYVKASDLDQLHEAGVMTNELTDALIEVGKASGIKFATEDFRGLLSSLEEGWLTADKLKESLNMGSVDTSGSIKNLDELREAALRVIRGDYGNDMAERFRLLEEEGFDAQRVQDYVNKLHKLAGGTWNLTDEIIAQADAEFSDTVITEANKLQGLKDELVKLGEGGGVNLLKRPPISFQELIDKGWEGDASDFATVFSSTFTDATESIAVNFTPIMMDENGNYLGALSPSELEKYAEDVIAGVHDDYLNLQIGSAFTGENAIADAEAAAERIHDLHEEIMTVDNLITQLETTQRSGRENLFDAIKNAFSGIERIVLMVKSAWKSVFPPASADGFRNITEKIKDLSDSFKTFAINNARKIFKFFQGLFSLLAIGVDIVKTLASGAFFLLGKAIGFLAPIIGNVLVKIAELITGFRNWITENQLVETAIAAIGGVMETVGAKIQGFADKVTGVFKFGGRVVELFMHRMNALGGFSFENLIKSFTFVKRAVFDYIERKFPAFGKFRDAISSIGEKIKTAFGGIEERLGKPFEKFFSILDFGRRVVNLFMKRMDALGGFSFDNLIKSFKFVKRAVLDYLSNKFPGFAKFREGFNNLASGINDTVDKIKTTISNLFNSFIGASDTPLKDIFAQIQTDITKWFTSLPEKFAALKSSVFVFFSGIWTSISTSIASAWPAVKEAFTNLWANVKDWFKSNGGIDLSFLEKVFNGLKIAIFAISVIVGVALGGIVAAIAGVVLAVRAGWKAISGFFKSISQNEAVKTGINKIKTKLSGAFDKIKKVIDGGRQVFDLFMKKLNSLGGFSFENIVESFNFVKEKVFDFFSRKFPGFDKFKSSFNKIIDKIKEGLSSMGLNSDGLKSKWHRFTTFAVDAFSTIRKKGSEAWTNLRTSVGKFFNNPAVKQGIAKLKSGFASLWDSLKVWIGGFGSVFDNFLNTVKSNGGFAIDNIGNIFTAFKDTIGNYFKGFTGFDGLKEAFTSIWNDIVAWFEGTDLYKTLEDFKKRISDAFSNFSLPDVFGTVIGWFTKSSDDLGDAADDTETQAASMLGSITSFVTEANETLEKFKLPKIFQDFLDLFKKNNEETEKVAGETEEANTSLIEAASGLIDRLVESVNDMDTEKLKDIVGIIKDALIGIGVLFAGQGIKAGGKAFKEIGKGFKLNSALDTITQLSILVGAIAGLAAVIGTVSYFVDSDKLEHTITWIGGLIVAIAVAVRIAAGGLAKLQSYDADTITGWQAVLTNLLSSLFNKAFILGLIAVSSWAIKNLVDGEGIDAEKLEAAATAIAKVAGVGAVIAIAIGAMGKWGIDGDAALKGMEALGVVLGVGGAAAGIFALIAEFAKWLTGDQQAVEGFKYLIDEGFDMISSIAKGVGKVVGSLIGGLLGGIAGGFSDSFETIAQNVVKFVEAIAPLGDGKHKIDAGAINDALGAIAKVSFTGFMSSVLDLVGNGGVAGKLTNVLLGEKNETMVEKVSDAMGTIATAIKSWQKKLQGITEITLPDGFGHLVTEIEKINAIGFKSAMETMLMNLGFGATGNGIMAIIHGPKTPVDQFGEAVDDVAEIVKKWNDTFGDKAATIAFDYEGFNSLVESVDKIDDGGLGGFLGRLLGTESKTGEFAGDMGKLGEGISAFATATAGISIGAEVLTAVRVIGTLAEAAAIVGDAAVTANYTPFIEFLEGNSLHSSIAEALNAFANNLDLSTEDYGKMSKVARSAKDVATFVTSIAAIAINDVDMSNTTLVTNFCTDIRDVVDAITYTTTGDYSSVEAFTSAIESIAGAGIAEAAEALDKQQEQPLTLSLGVEKQESVGDSIKEMAGEASKEAEANQNTFTTIATNMVSALATTLSSDESIKTVGDAITILVSSVISSARLSVGQFTQLGINFADGLTSGMSGIGVIFRARAAAAALGRHALDALRHALDSHSPSKETNKIGVDFDDGLIGGMRRKFGDIYDTSSEAGSLAARGLRSSIRALNSMIEDGLDSTPVIRPVLDMTNIQNGSLALNSMIGGNVPVGIAGNLTAINANVNARNMTTNADILTALNDLGSALSRRPAQTNQYNINGITYDDGSNITDAVRTLIHAAKIERRV